MYTKGCESPDFNSPHLGCQNTLDFINITDTEVYTALSNLNTTKACGRDGIGPKMLCCSALALYPSVIIVVSGTVIFLLSGSFTVLYQFTSVGTKCQITGQFHFCVPSP